MHLILWGEIKLLEQLWCDGHATSRVHMPEGGCIGNMIVTETVFTVKCSSFGADASHRGRFWRECFLFVCENAIDSADLKGDQQEETKL